MQNHFEQLESVWSELYEPRYGSWRPYVLDLIYIPVYDSEFTIDTTYSQLPLIDCWDL